MKNPIQSVGEAMLTRRRTLGLLAAVTIPPTAVVGATPIVAAATPMTAQERYDYHLAELKKAAMELDPRIGDWDCSRAEREDLRCALVITAFRVTGRYEGDGTYERASANWNGAHTKYQVRLLDYRIDGKRMFDVRTSMERMVLAESVLNTFIGRKVGELA